LEQTLFLLVELALRLHELLPVMLSAPQQLRTVNVELQARGEV
jgi:hypothetical protein